MRNLKKTLAVILTAFAILVMIQPTSLAAQGFGRGYIDENGDGFNDYALDTDGDGIPDFHDPDSPSFVDENGDGYNDNARDDDGDGIPNFFDEDYVRQAKDGSGYKASELGLGQRSGFNRINKGTLGTGTCDGTGVEKRK
eukprot:Anaeramoba_ignava/a2384_3.p1 GENE.a2384_3~~a2384_3.p1  ORF type:complete len:140 (+),score=36.03 a2384_3:180-599(+)